MTLLETFQLSLKNIMASKTRTFLTMLGIIIGVCAVIVIVGLGDKLKHKPQQLSGGQQQRVSIARALAGRPAVILADEPTGALDSKTSKEIIDIFHDLHSQGNTIVLITHDGGIAKQAQRSIHILDGQISEVVL